MVEKFPIFLQRHHERSNEQEKIEKQRQMPFHQHINLEMLECVYLVSGKHNDCLALFDIFHRMIH